MTHFSGRIVGYVLVFSVLLVLGILAGRRDGAGSVGKEGASTPPQGKMDIGEKAVSRPGVGFRANEVSGVPADLKNLDGKEFVDSLPALEALARRGDLDAVHVLLARLGSCVDYQPVSDEEIRKNAESEYRGNLDAAKRLRAGPNGYATDPRLSDESLLRSYETALKAAFDQRDLCTSLTPRQMEERFNWMRIALERHDRQTILDALLPGSGIGNHGIERVRNAEELNAIAQIERSELDALIATGDATALNRAAFAFGSGSNSFFQRDAALAYAYAFAWTLTGSTENAWQTRAMKTLMQDLASGQGLFPPLTSDEIDQARARGSSIFESCCAPRVRN